MMPTVHHFQLYTRSITMCEKPTSSGGGASAMAAKSAPLPSRLSALKGNKEFFS
jgi:hypothetical protein